jgi:hypothetical protein
MKMNFSGTILTNCDLLSYDAMEEYIASIFRVEILVNIYMELQLRWSLSTFLLLQEPQISN